MKAFEALKTELNLTVLKGLIIIFTSIYLILSYFPKHGDFFSIMNMSLSFTRYGLGFLDAINGFTDYPPTFFIIQGSWLKLGTILFNFNLNNYIVINHQNETVYPTFIQLWAMVPHIFCLVALVAIMYRFLKNKWLVLLCFGALTFVSTIIMGQIDIFEALCIGLSMVFLIKTCNNDNYKINLLLSFLFLGISVQFKTFGILLFPVYVIFSYAIYLTKRVDFVHTIYDYIMYVLVFVISAFVIWLPFIKWFVPIYLLGTTGENRFLFAIRLVSYSLPPMHTLSIWQIGYFLLLYLFFNIVRNDYRKIYSDPKYPLFFVFATLSWFFIAVYNHPQWWVILLPAILLVLDNFKSKINYLFAFGIMSLFIFYSMLWTNNLDKIIDTYLPIISISGQNSIILMNLIISILVIWTLELYLEISGRVKDLVDDDSNTNNHNNNKIDLSNIAPLVITIFPFLFCLIVGIVTLMITGVPATENISPVKPAGEICGNNVTGQSFIAKNDNLSGIDVHLGTYVRTNTKDVVFHLKTSPNSEDIARIKINGAKIEDNTLHRFSFPEIKDSKGRQFYFEIESPESYPGNAITAWCNYNTTYSSGSMYKNGAPMTGDLVFKTYYKSNVLDILFYIIKKTKVSLQL